MENCIARYYMMCELVADGVELVEIRYRKNKTCFEIYVIIYGSI